MNSPKMLAFITVLITLLTACSDVPADIPSESDVEGLIETQYKQASTVPNDAMALANNDKNNKSFNNMIESARPTLDSIANVNCEVTKGDDTYLCSADITQTMNGHTSTNQGSFKVYKVDNKWALDL